jgi:hypothetical protein
MGERQVTCARCRRGFDWDQAYWTQRTPLSGPHNPSLRGEFRPRAYCPNCGALVAEWHVNRERDYDEWGWFAENDTVNAGRPLPPDPATSWGHPILDEGSIPSYDEHSLDVVKIRDLEATRS